MWYKKKVEHLLLWTNLQWPCNLLILFKNFLYPQFLKFFKKKRKKKKVGCLVFFKKGKGISVQSWTVTKNLKQATTYFHAGFFWKKKSTFKWRSIISRWSCLGVVIVNKSKKLQFDRTVFGYTFSTMGHLSLPKIQLTSDNSREANPSSDIQTKQWSGRIWKQDLRDSLRKKEIQQNKNPAALLSTAGTTKSRIVSNIISNLVLWDRGNLIAYLCTCC